MGSDDHYDAFESLISGRDLYDEDQAADQRFRGIFAAQVLKDAAM